MVKKHTDSISKVQIIIFGALGALIPIILELSFADYDLKEIQLARMILQSVLGATVAGFLQYQWQLIRKLNDQISHVIDNQEINNKITQFNSRSNEKISSLIKLPSPKLRSACFTAISQLYKGIHFGEEWVSLPGEYLALSSYTEFWKTLVLAQEKLNEAGSKKKITVWATHSMPISLWNRDTQFSSLMKEYQRKFVENHKGQIARILINPNSSLNAKLGNTEEHFLEALNDMRSRGTNAYYFNAEEVSKHRNLDFDFMVAKVPAASVHDRDEYLVAEWHMGSDKMRIEKCVFYESQEKTIDLLTDWEYYFAQSLSNTDTVKPELQTQKDKIPVSISSLMSSVLSKKIEEHFSNK